MEKTLQALIDELRKTNDLLKQIATHTEAIPTGLSEVAEQLEDIEDSIGAALGGNNE